MIKLLIFVYMCGIFSRLNITTKQIESNPKKYNNIFIYIVILILILVSGLRYNVGTDYWTYSNMYTINIPNMKINDIIKSNDIGFTILCKILYEFSENPQFMFLIVSVITIIPIVFMIKNYSYSFELSLYLYITTFAYFSSFNILRQWIAASIISYGFKYLLERNLKKYSMIILIASIFHATSIIMFPIYFIADKNPRSLINLVLLIVSLLGVLFYRKFLDVAFNVLKNTQYSNYYSEFMNVGQGVNILRILVYIVPIFWVIIKYKNINVYEDKKIDIIINLSFIGMLFMILGIRHKYIARMTALFDIYYVLLIPYILRTGNKKSNKLIYYTIIVMYFIYWYLLLIRGEGGVFPYRFNMNIF